MEVVTGGLAEVSCAFFYFLVPFPSLINFTFSFFFVVKVGLQSLNLSLRCSFAAFFLLIPLPASLWSSFVIFFCTVVHAHLGSGFVVVYSAAIVS